jgi:hypothetical protein
MTRMLNRPEAEIAREARTPVRLPVLGSSMFQGWGPKF